MVATRAGYNWVITGLPPPDYNDNRKNTFFPNNFPYVPTVSNSFRQAVVLRIVGRRSGEGYERGTAAIMKTATAIANTAICFTV